MLSDLSLPQVALLAILAVGIEMLCGSLRRNGQPLAGFGRYAAAIERSLNRRTHRGRESPFASGWRGALAWLLAVLPLLALAIFLTRIEVFGLLLHGLLLYACLGLHNLRRHGRSIADALAKGDVAGARLAMTHLIGPAAGQLPPAALPQAGADAVLAKGNEALIGPLFWFVVAGGPGVLLYRLAHMLHARWGGRNRRYRYFGSWAGYQMRWLNAVPARLTAWSLQLLAATLPARQAAWQGVRALAASWLGSPAGSGMASGAGAPDMAMGSAALDDPPVPGEIARAWQLLASAAILWLAVLTLASALDCLLR